MPCKSSPSAFFGTSDRPYLGRDLRFPLSPDASNQAPCNGRGVDLAAILRQIIEISHEIVQISYQPSSSMSYKGRRPVGMASRQLHATPYASALEFPVPLLQ
jgi:hypothetical protein